MDNKIEVKKNNKNDAKTSLNLDYENNKINQPRLFQNFYLYVNFDIYFEKIHKNK